MAKKGKKKGKKAKVKGDAKKTMAIPEELLDKLGY
jgi:hypothetical protein